MENIFLEKGHHTFSWEGLGDIREGRESLGEEMPVLVYRMLEYSLNHVLAEEFGAEIADEMFRRAGYLAGMEYAKNILPLEAEFHEFVAKLQESLKELKIGIMRVEEYEEDGKFVLTVAEDLDCSGLPPTNEVVCFYDEGFLAGIMEAYTGSKYRVKEIDCWASGARVCRFKGEQEHGE